MNICNRWRFFSLLIGMSSAGAVNAADCNYIINSDWDSGFSTTLRITNNSSNAINGWTVSLAFADGSSIQTLWNGQLNGSGPYEVNNAPHNGLILPNSSVEFGFNGAKNSNAPATVPALGGVCDDEPGPPNRVPVAVPTASSLSGTVPFDVVFDGSGSSDPDGDPLSYQWRFGNGDTSSSASVTRTFTQAGSYPISLTVNDGSLDSETVTLTVTANEIPPPTASFVLDAEKSSIFFVSTKKTHVMETHTFNALSGTVSAAGDATLNINLASVDTNNDTRDERMRTMLFDVGTYVNATVSLQVDMANIAGISTGNSQSLLVSANLDLHGVSATIDTELKVTKLSTTSILVQNSKPIVINANDYDLNLGVDALRDIANLSVISYAVPVNFNLLFNAP